MFWMSDVQFNVCVGEWRLSCSVGTAEELKPDFYSLKPGEPCEFMVFVCRQRSSSRRARSERVQLVVIFPSLTLRSGADDDDESCDLGIHVDFKLNTNPSQLVISWIPSPPCAMFNPVRTQCWFTQTTECSTAPSCIMEHEITSRLSPLSSAEREGYQSSGCWRGYHPLKQNRGDV